VRITRGDLTARGLRASAAKCSDGAQVRRILALALVMEGRPRREAAAFNGMDRQTLSDWVHRYNADGIEGLKSRKSPGRTAFLSAAQKAELRELVIQGPDPAVHKVVRWRCVDLWAEVARRWSVEVHESTIGAWLGELGLTRLQPRPVHPKKDAEAEVTFKKPLTGRCPPVVVETGSARLRIGGGAAAKFLVVRTPSKNMAHGLLRA
jgi:transposase